MNFLVNDKQVTLDVEETFRMTRRNGPVPMSGLLREVKVNGLPQAYDLRISRLNAAGKPSFGRPSVDQFDRDGNGWTTRDEHGKPFGRYFSRLENEDGKAHCVIRYSSRLEHPPLSVTLKPLPPAEAHKITSMPGFDGVQLPVSTKIMPTAMTVLDDGRLAFASLEGHVYIAKDTDGDGVEDELTMFEEGLSAPYGIIQDGDSLLVSHKPEILRLRDTDGDGRADERTVFSSGWGINDNYHDWTCGILAATSTSGLAATTRNWIARKMSPAGEVKCCRFHPMERRDRLLTLSDTRQELPSTAKATSSPQTIRACRTRSTS